jgi:hypothetical protein
VGLVEVGAACGDDGARPTEDLRVETAHIVVVASPSRATMAEVDAVAQRAETLFGAIASYVGPARTPDERVRIILEGDVTSAGSYLDVDGIHLARYSEAEGGYLAVLAHELVHAFGATWFIEHEAWDWPTYRYFDEAFAEYLALEVDPGKTGFPFFGFPEDAVVGHWVAAGQSVPHSALRSRHEGLNDRCDLQAYTLRASWMRHLAERAGRAAVLAVAYPDGEPTSAVVRSITGLGLEDLDAAWEAWARARFEARSDTAAVRQACRARTPWYQPCVPGVEY